MHGVVSLLDERHYELVASIWREMRAELGLQGVYVTLFHFLTRWQSIMRWRRWRRCWPICPPDALPLRCRRRGWGILRGLLPCGLRQCGS